MVDELVRRCLSAPAFTVRLSVFAAIGLIKVHLAFGEHAIAEATMAPQRRHAS